MFDRDFLESQSNEELESLIKEIEDSVKDIPYYDENDEFSSEHQVAEATVKEINDVLENR